MIPYYILGFAYFLAFVVAPIVEYQGEKKRIKSWDEYINSTNKNELDKKIKNELDKKIKNELDKHKRQPTKV